MTEKRLLRPDRLRHVPAQFSWIDHRLVRQNRLQKCNVHAWALYLFLLTVSDARGLSYYSDASISRQLSVDPLDVASARRQLIDAELIAYQKPLYQVLALVDARPAHASSVSTDGIRSIGDILRQALGGVS